MTDQKTLTVMLGDAKRFLGKEALVSLLPDPLKISIHSHDTGIQIEIFASTDGVPRLSVWRGSVWYSSAYEFNDRGWVLGFQPDAEFMRPVIEKFFSDVAAAFQRRQDEIEVENNLREMARQAKENTDTMIARATYAAMLGLKI